MKPDELSERLQTLLRDRLDDPTIEVGDLRRLTGGASRETWSFEAGSTRYVLQRERAGSPRTGQMAVEASVLRAAGDRGVPVARLVAAGEDEGGLGSGFLVSAFVEGETIARKILRDDDFAPARPLFAAQCGRALAAIHSIPLDAVPGLVETDQVTQYREVLDSFGDPHPVFEFAFRWLEEHRPAGTGTAVVHGDFRLGNLMIGPDGLRAVVDWELAHLGDPMEDLGWLCVRAWRFGGEQPVGGLGSYEDLFAAYAEASGTALDADVVRWWEVLGTLKWGIMCIMQARAHLDGWSRSVELATIGRRVCENEYDLLRLLAPGVLDEAVARPPGDEVSAASVHGRPTASELLEAVREWIDNDVSDATTGRVRFHARVASNALAIVERELASAPVSSPADEQRLARGIRDGSIGVDDALLAVLADTVVHKLRVANPRYL